MPADPVARYHALMAMACPSSGASHNERSTATRLTEQLRAKMGWKPCAIAHVDGMREPGGDRGGWGYTVALPEGGDETRFGELRARTGMSDDFAVYCALGALVADWKRRRRIDPLVVNCSSRVVVAHVELGRPPRGACGELYRKLRTLLAEVTFEVRLELLGGMNPARGLSRAVLGMR